MPIDWIAKLRHLLQTLAFSLTISAAQFALQPERPYAVPLVYSLAIGTTIWAWVDFGRHLVPTSAETGWPHGWRGLLLVLSGIVAGYVIGTVIGDGWFGWSSWGSADGRKLQPASALITVFAGIVGTYYFYSVNKGAWLERKIVEARQHAGEARLKLLEAQLEPHMLFNTLANLRALIGADPERAQRMLDHLIAYLRATLAASRATTHPLAAEFERLRDYLELMAIRMGPRLAYTLELPAELGAQPVPTLLLQPLVENSIRHGLEPKVAGGSVRVAARREGSTVVIDVSDTGVGQRDAPSGDPPPPDATGGFGIAQVQERLATLYGSAAHFEFTSVPGEGARTRLRFPMQAAPPGGVGARANATP